jgi:hypothetical protein
MERGPALSLLITVGALILGPGIHIYTIVIALVLLIVGRWALVKLAEYDPQCEAILIRYSTYDWVYEAESPLEVYETLWSRLVELTNTTAKPLAGPGRPAVPTRGEV